MIGIYGFVNMRDKGRNKESDALLERMGKVLSHYYNLSSQSSIKNPAYLGVIKKTGSNDGNLFYDEVNDIEIAFSGIIYNDIELKDELKRSSITVDCDPGIVIELYKLYGIEFVKNINGPFSCAIWDGKNKRFTIAVDRHSHRHVFYSITKDRVIFAPRIKGILQDKDIKRNLDETTFAHIVNMGYPFGDGTLIKDVKWLPFGTILVVEDGKIRTHKYFDYRYSEDSRGVRNKMAFELGENIRTVIERIINKNGNNGARVGTFISGGMDSRTIAGVSAQLIKGIDAYNHLTGHPGDIEIARWIAEKIGARYHYIKLEDDYIAKHSTEQVWVAEGLVDATCSHFYSIGPYIKEVDTILDGLEGRVIFGYYLNPKKFEDISKKDYFNIFYSNRWLKYFNSDTGKEIFGDKIKIYEEMSKEEVRNYFLSIPQDHYLNCWHYFYITTYLPKFLKLSLSAMNLFINIVTPYYDNNIIDLMLKSTPEERAYKRLYRLAMNYILPEISHIPSNWYGMKPSAGEFELLTKRLLAKFDVELNKRGINSLIKTLYSNGRTFNYAKSISTSSRPFIIKTLLSDRCLSRGIFNPEGIKKMLWEHNHGVRDHIKRIGYLLSFELFFRLFLDKDSFNGLSI
ncbi:MAG: asparagine synthase-related protein [bacterium]